MIQSSAPQARRPTKLSILLATSAAIGVGCGALIAVNQPAREGADAANAPTEDTVSSAALGDPLPGDANANTTGSELGADVAADSVVLAGELSGGPQPSQATRRVGPGPLLDPDETSWASVRDRTSAQFKADFDKWISRDYIVVDVEADTFDGELRLGAVFQKNTDNRDSFVKTRMTATEYKDYFDWADSAQLRLIDQETYVLDGERRFAAAWVENVEGVQYSALYDLTPTEFQAYYEQQKAAGRMPIDVDLYATAKGVRRALVWVDNPEQLGWRLHGDLTSESFSSAFDSYAAQGMRMLSFDSATAPDQRYGGVWVEDANGRGFLMRRGMSSQQYANWWNLYSDEGWRPIFAGRYPTGDGPKYAAIWRRNSDRPVWKYKDLVNTRVKEELDDYQVPGISVAVMQDGEFRYIRGFGHADIDAGVWLDSKHVMRMASVSKAVTGVLTMRLQELDEVAAHATASTYVDNLPSHHTATIEQLANNRGCVRHYDNSATDSTLANSWYANATAAADDFWDEDLVAGCTIGDYNYSTHGYTLLAAALEGATGDTIDELLHEHVFQPTGLSTMRLEDISDTTQRRAQIYGTDNEVAERDELSWKEAGGGLEADVRDLARFGVALLNDQIITAFSRGYMWDGAAGDYRYGWSIRDDDNGHRYVEKTGGQLGSDAYLMIYPDDDIVIAVLSNREEVAEGEHNTEDIGEYIGNLMTADLP